MEFYLQDVLVCTLSTMPYQWSWDTRQYPNGEYTIIVKAYDKVGNVKTSQNTITVRNMEPGWWEPHFWTIIQVLIGVGGLLIAVLTYVTRREKEAKKESAQRKKKTKAATSRKDRSNVFFCRL